MNVVIACGGSGGHFFPGLAVAETLTARRHRVLMLVSRKPIESAMASAMQGSAPIELRQLDCVGLNGNGRNAFQFAWLSARSTRDCARIYREFCADVVLGMGGFVSAPAVFAAFLTNTPAVIHESNAAPGKANRLAARFADRVAVTFPECAPIFGRNGHVIITGTPLRQSLRQKISENPHEVLGLNPSKRTILIFGGSQGAHVINTAVVDALPQLRDLADRIQFVHLTGQRDYEFVADAYKKNGGGTAKVLPFCHEMNFVYSITSLVVSRAGAAALAELAFFGLPSLLVPFAGAAGDHQRRNAETFARAGAARMILQNGFSSGRFAQELRELLADEHKLADMARASRRLAVPRAAENVADLVESLC
jgi:UDP-N-acetylglucosamine--N-acetylmuramyl-(pentapeptide) pyrophosphoryl-undecaprenol N-acetylglucosamine transferase